MLSVINNKAQAAEFVGIGWTAPTTNADNSSYDDAGGFIIYYDTISHSGTCPSIYGNSSPYGNSVNVSDSSAVYQAISGLTAGTTYYFTLVAYDTSHNISTCTSEISHPVYYSADFNNDGTVNSLDYTLLRNNYNAHNGPSKGDANRSGTIDSLDYTFLRNEYNSHL